MRVVFCVPDMGAGGAERVISILSSQFCQRGYNVEICMFFGNQRHYKLPKEVRVESLNLLSEDRRFQRFKILRDYFKHIKINESDGKVVAVAFQDSCLNYLLCSTLGMKIRIIASERGNPYRKGTSLYSRLMASFPYLLSDSVVFQTPDAREYYKILSKSRNAVIPNPIMPSSVRWHECLSADRLISVCRLESGKNVEMTLDAIALLKSKYPDIHLTVFGEGGYLTNLMEYAEMLDVVEYVTFAGTTDDIIEKLSLSSIYISTSKEEGISNSMLEAMSVGMPVICTDCPIGGARLMLNDGCGILIPIGDVQCLAKNIDLILSKELDVQNMVMNTYLRSRQYSPDGIASMWENVLHQ